MAHFFYINPEFETCGASIWTKKLNLGTPNVHVCSFDQLRLLKLSPFRQKWVHPGQLLLQWSYLIRWFRIVSDLIYRLKLV